jgi:hypothetical protein
MASDKVETKEKVERTWKERRDEVKREFCSSES